MHEVGKPSSPALRPGPETAPSETRFSGWRLIVARTIAFSVMNVTMLLGVIALVNWRRLATPCADAFNTCLMTPEQVAPLARLGITTTGLALGVVLICCAAIALTNAVAALSLWRRSDDAMALLVVVTLILLPAFFTPLYQPLTGVWREVSRVVNGLGGISFLLLVLLFSSGHFAPRWIWAPVASGVAFIFTLGGRLPSAVVVPIILLWALTLIGGQIYRYRRISSPVHRQQTKWAVTGIVLAIVVNQLFWQPAGLVPALQRKDSLYPLLLYPDFALLISILAVCFGVAILRFRLYDIDIIIRRTLIYGTLTALLAGLYAVVVIVAQLVGQRLTGESAPPPWLVVMTTLLIAALFNPLRGRVQVGIDRRFYRSKYNAARAIEAYAATLRSEMDLEGLSAHLVEVAQATMQPTQITLWVRATQTAPPVNTVYSEAAPESRGDPPR